MFQKPLYYAVVDVSFSIEGRSGLEIAADWVKALGLVSLVGGLLVWLQLCAWFPQYRWLDAFVEQRPAPRSRSVSPASSDYVTPPAPEPTSPLEPFSIPYGWDRLLSQEKSERRLT